MKILFSITYFEPYVSGLTIAASRWAQGLIQLGEEVTVLAMRHDKTLPKKEQRKKVTIHRASPIASISKGFLSIDWIWSAWRLSKVHDTVVLHLPQPEGSLLAVFAKFFGKRLVCVYHCEIDLPPGFLNRIAQWSVELSNWVSMRLADAVITYTQDYARHSKLLTSLDVIDIVPPVPTPIVKTSITKTIKQKIGTAEFVVGVAARLAKEKGIEYLIAAMDDLPGGYKLVVAGPMDPVGEARYKNHIMKLVARFGSRIVFLGEISAFDMGSFYACIDVLVLPSVNSTEAFGLVQIEAMLTGVPVIASDLPGVRVPIEQTGMGIVVQKKRSDALVSAIHTIKKHKDRFVKSRNHIRTFYNEQSSIKNFHSLLVS